jgi:hypothetical protein
VALLLQLCGIAPSSAAWTTGAGDRIGSCGALSEATATADGTAWVLLGYLPGCTSRRMELLHRSPTGSGWTREALPYAGEPVAIADDGAVTFFLFRTGGQLGGGERGLSIAKVPHGGRASAATPLADELGSDQDIRASLAVRDGKWWAVWDVVRYTYDANGRTGETSTLWQARSVAPAYAARRVDLGSSHDYFPRLGLRGDGAVLAATRFESDGTGSGYRPVLASADRTGTFSSVSFGAGSGTSAVAASLVVAGGRTLVATQEATGRIALAMDDGHLRFSTRTVPTRAGPSTVRLAVSGGFAFVGHSECFTARSGQDTCRAYVARAGVTGGFTTTELSAPWGATSPDIAAHLTALTAARGKGIAVLSLAPGGDQRVASTRMVAVRER